MNMMKRAESCLKEFLFGLAIVMAIGVYIIA